MHSTQSLAACSTANCFWGPKPRHALSITRAPCVCARATVSSALPESTTTISAQKFSESRQASICEAAFRVMRTADNGGGGAGIAIIRRIPRFYRASMRILLVKTSSLGDVVHNLPMVSDLLQRYPEAVIDWVVEEAFTDIPRLHPAVRHVVPVALRRWRRRLWSPSTWRQWREFVRHLREEPYDVVLDSQGLIKSAIIVRRAQLAAGGRRCGFDADSAREPFAARYYDHRYAVARNQHAVVRNRQLAAAAAGTVIGLAPDYGISAPPLAADWLPKGGYAVLLTATSRADKEWPEPDWQALGMALIAAGLRCVLPAGNDDERKRAARLATALGRAVAAPPMRIADLAALMAGAALVVGVDTGLVHLAAALGRPTLALFCGSDPSLTGVLAGDDCVNLGGRGAPPTAPEAVAQALHLLA
jgi:heptosyltransferase-1